MEEYVCSFNPECLDKSDEVITRYLTTQYLTILDILQHNILRTTADFFHDELFWVIEITYTFTLLVGINTAAEPTARHRTT